MLTLPERGLGWSQREHSPCCQRGRPCVCSRGLPIESAAAGRNEPSLHLCQEMALAGTRMSRASLENRGVTSLLLTDSVPSSSTPFRRRFTGEFPDPSLACPTAESELAGRSLRGCAASGGPHGPGKGGRGRACRMQLVQTADKSSLRRSSPASWALFNEFYVIMRLIKALRRSKALSAVRRAGALEVCREDPA